MKKQEVIMYPVYENKFKTLLNSTDETIKSLSEKCTFGETTIRRSIKNGKMNKDLLLEIAEAFRITPYELWQIVCFKNKNSLQATQRKLMEGYLDKKGA